MKGIGQLPEEHETTVVYECCTQRDTACNRHRTTNSSCSDRSVALDSLLPCAPNKPDQNRGQGWGQSAFQGGGGAVQYRAKVMCMHGRTEPTRAKRGF